MTRPTAPTGSPPRSRGLSLLAALLTLYAMGGVLLVTLVSGAREGRERWWLVAVAAAAFALASGMSALAVWRVERRAPLLLALCATLGASLCIALPFSVSSEVLAPGMWRAAVQGAVLIFAFLMLAAWYVRGALRRAA